MSWEIFLRDENLNICEQIDFYSRVKLEMNLNAVSTWQMDVPMDMLSTDAEVQVKMARVRELLALKDKSGIIAKLDDQIKFSGPFKSTEEDDQIDSDTFALNGYDDLVFLSDRLIYPDKNGLPFAAEADTRTGAAETVMKGYVTDHAGPGAVGYRQVSGLTIAMDMGAGWSIDESVRNENMLDVLQRAAIKGGDLGFQVLQADAGLEFQVFVPEDLSDQVNFSKEMGNIAHITQGEERPKCNAVLVGGSGEGVSRTFVEVIDPVSIVQYGRIEKLLDKRNTSDVTELRAEGQAYLEKNGALRNISVLPVDLPNFTYGVDYDLGTRVSIMIGSTAYAFLIQQIVIELAPGKEPVIKPVIGTVGARIKQPFSKTSNRISAVEQRVDQLESGV
jgi:hypothetical protein